MGTWASVGISAEAEAATSHDVIAEPTGRAVGLLSSECGVPRVQGGGERDPAWVILFVDDPISVDI